MMEQLPHEQDDTNEEWNAYFVAPFVIGVGVGAVFGSLFAMGKPAYAAWLITLSGFAMILAGLLMYREACEE